MVPLSIRRHAGMEIRATRHRFSSELVTVTARLLGAVVAMRVSGYVARLERRLFIRAIGKICLLRRDISSLRDCLRSPHDDWQDSPHHQW